ncbi:MAG TPA: YhjD/YihY/BrkB family envelope integrity protein [Streptosporangiaceae bacterium]|jgi:YihY family inner membrane protein
MSRVKRTIRAADQWQQRRPWAALPVAVVRKFFDNRGWNLAALVAYYGFIALFPLLLVLLTVLNVLIRHDSGLRHRLVNSALAHYPVIGPQLRDNLTPLKQTGIALVVGLAGMLIGSRGVVRAMQNALNAAWEVPVVRRPAFPWSYLRGFAALVVLGVSLIATSTLSGLASGAGEVLTGVGSAILALAISLVLNCAMFWLVFRLCAAPEVGGRALLPGALLGALAWQIMQAIGGYLITHQVARSSDLYGTFAIVLGLIGWLYFDAQLTVWAIEVNVVIVRRLWPRSLAPPRIAADRRAYAMYADVERRDDSH